MQEEEKKWIKWIILAVFCGGIIGATLKQIFIKFLSAKLQVLGIFCIPTCIIIALLIVLYKYNREKEQINGK